MPAPKSILRTSKEKKPFAPVDNASTLYTKVVQLCLKMPKRYTYLILQPVIHVAAEVMEETKKANSVFPQNQREYQIRRNHWIEARASLQALSSHIDRLVELPGVLSVKENGKKRQITEHELFEIGSLIISEMALIKHQLSEEKERYKDLDP